MPAMNPNNDNRKPFNSSQTLISKAVEGRACSKGITVQTINHVLMTFSTNTRSKNLYYYYLTYSLIKKLGRFSQQLCQLVASD